MRSTKSLISFSLAWSAAFGALIPGIASENPANVLAKRDTFSCEGNSQCDTLPNMLKYCDIAVNTNLRRGTGYIYRSSTLNALEGECSANVTGNGCGVLLEGPADCAGSGDDLWNGYQQIRENGCGVCGFKEFAGEAGGVCRLKIDFVSGCADANA